MASKRGVGNGGDEKEFLLHFFKRLKNRAHNRRVISFTGGVHDKTASSPAPQRQISAAAVEAARCERLKQ